MKKVLLAILLICLIFAVSYLKTVRDDKERSEALAEISATAEREEGRLRDSVDSLQGRLKGVTASYEDSLRHLDDARRQETDSLGQMVQASEETIRGLSVGARSEAAQTGQASQVAKVDSLDFHRRVLTYYRKRFTDLPGDLSRYERRVALSEIRQETARRFSISVDSLNRIRTKNKLDF